MALLAIFIEVNIIVNDNITITIFTIRGILKAILLNFLIRNFCKPLYLII